MENQITKFETCFLLFKNEIVKNNFNTARWDNVNSITNINYDKMEDVLRYLKTVPDSTIKLFITDVLYKNFCTEDDFILLLKGMHLEWLKKENLSYAQKFEPCIKKIEKITKEMKDHSHLKNSYKNYFCVGIAL
ncbi:MAG TPA: hypothetical protein VL201_03020 [Patescibacteria group bacterium]|jgi:hypothetical protein|nr:hypothetical protein [Patescibacteria group bacterium]